MRVCESKRARTYNAIGIRAFVASITWDEPGEEPYRETLSDNTFRTFMHELITTIHISHQIFALCIDSFTFDNTLF